VRPFARALNAATMGRVFARHAGAMEAVAIKPGFLATIASGSWNGGASNLVQIWDETM
jgi:hypothetical protein